MTATTLIYQPNEIEIPEFIAIGECPKLGMRATRLDNCLKCDRFEGLTKFNPPADSSAWEYQIVCAAPLRRTALNVI